MTSNVVSGSCGSVDPTLWELRGERVNIFVSNRDTNALGSECCCIV